MDIVHLRVAGIDGRKKVVWVAVRVPGAGPGERMVVTMSFKTFWQSLTKMAAWLPGLGVTGAAMERPGVLVAGLPRAGPGCDRGVCNAAHMRNVPGCKRMSRTASGSLSCTNPGCCGQLHPGGRGGRAAGAHPVPQKLIEQWVSQGERLAKVLEDAGIKTGLGGGELLGKSGRAMIEALIAGSATRLGWPIWPWAGSGARPRSCRWPATAGSPRATRRCVGIHVYLKRALLNRSLFGFPVTHRWRLARRYA